MNESVANKHSNCSTPLVRLVFPAEPRAVRKALKRVAATLEPMPILPENLSTVEIVLAEVLNNIVEHAYGDDATGSIELSIDHQGSLLCVELTDQGQPMPCGEPPDGHPVVLGHALERLPEGGFGWFLIRTMTGKLDYKREPGRNRLWFELQLGTPSA